MNKFNDVVRKRALVGVGIFCIAAVTTVGALSLREENEEQNPGQLVDLNETNPSEKGEGYLAEQPDTADSKKENKPDTTDSPKADAEKPEVKDDDKTQTADSKSPAEDTKKADSTKVEIKPEETDGDKIQTAEQPETDQKAEVLSPQVIAEQLTYHKENGLKWPVQGEILIPYSPDHGVYYTTLDQFATSEAIVISAEVGTQVLAAAKGVVIALDEDVRTGKTVTLAIGNNTQLVYGQLETGDLKAGDVLEEGACVGTVASPTRYYIEEGANVYFQVLEDGVSIDPTELLKEQ